MWVKSLGGEDPLEEGTATHSGLLVENPRYRGAWQATVCRAAKSQTRLIQLNTHIHTQCKKCNRMNPAMSPVYVGISH